MFGFLQFLATPPQIIFEKLFTNPNPSGSVFQNESYELGMKFQVAVPGKIHGCRYWRTPFETGSHTGNIWSSAGILQASAVYSNESASGWQEQLLATSLTVTPGVTYVVSVNINFSYISQAAGLATQITNGNVSSVDDNLNGLFATTPGTFPNGSFNESNYYIDILFLAD